MSSNLFENILLFLILFCSFILVLQNNSSHSTLNKVKCEKQILTDGIRTHETLLHSLV